MNRFLHDTRFLGLAKKCICFHSLKKIEMRVFEALTKFAAKSTNMIVPKSIAVLHIRFYYTSILLLSLKIHLTFCKLAFL